MVSAVTSKPEIPPGVRETSQHIRKVQTRMAEVMGRLKMRALTHDASKLEPPEVEAFERVAGALFGLTYGSEEYRRQLATVDLRPALEHHYSNNSHHPEYWSDGITGMSLLDLLEMLADWKAAGERHADGSMARSLAINRGRFGIPDALQAILENTAKELGWVD